MIRKGAAQAARRVRKGRVQPVKLAPPYEWEVCVKAGKEEALQNYLKREGAEQVDERTAVIRTPDPRAILR